MLHTLTGRARRIAYRNWLLLAAAVCLMTTTVFETFDAPMRWRPVGSNLLQAPTIPEHVEAWRTSRDLLSRRHDYVQLHVEHDRPMAYALQRIPIEGPGRYWITGEIRTEGVDADGGKIPSARAVVIPLDQNRKALFHRPHVAFEVVDDTPWKPFHGSIFIWDDVEEIDAGVFLHGHRGTCDVRNLEVRRSVENPLFGWFRKLLLVTWAALLARGAWLLFRGRRVTLPRLATSVMIAVILVGTATPVQWTEPFHYAVKRVFQDGTPPKPVGAPAEDTIPLQTRDSRTPATKPKPRPSSPQRTVRKVGHFVCFGLLAWAALLMRRRRRIRDVLALCLTVAVLTECLQYMSDGRGPGLFDIMIDMSGAALALALVLVLRPRRTCRARAPLPRRAHSSRPDTHPKRTPLDGETSSVTTPRRNRQP